MNNKLIQSFKNSSRQTMTFIIIFFLGVLYSSYKLFTLPSDLLIHGSVANVSLATGVFTKLSVVIILTFLAGMAAVGIAIQVKKETIVYIEKKKKNNTNADEGSRSDANDSELIDLDQFKKSIANEAEFLQKGLNQLCQSVQAGQGAIYLSQIEDGRKEIELKNGYALAVAETPSRFEFGEGLIGQVAVSGKSVYIDEVPEGYITIISGLGTSSPRYLLITPLTKGGDVKGVLEVATFQPLPERKRKQLEEMASMLAQRLI